MADRALPSLVTQLRVDPSKAAEDIRRATPALAAAAKAQSEAISSASASPLDAFLGPKTTMGQMSSAQLKNFGGYQGVTQRSGSRPSDMADIDSMLEKDYSSNLYGSSEFKGKVKAMQEYDAALQKHLGPIKAARAAEEEGSSTVKKSSGHLSELTGHSNRAFSGIERLGQQFGRLGAQSAGLSRLGSFLSPLTSFGPAGAALIGGAAVAGIGLVLDSAVKKQGEYATQVLRSAQATGLNNTQTQVYGRLLVDVGLKQEDLDKYLGFFHRNLQQGGPLLREQGTSLKTLGITSKDTGEAFLQAADYVSTHTDAVKNAAIAEALFGQGGAQLVPVLAQGREFFKGYTDELTRFGVLLDGDQLKTAAFQDAARTQFDLAKEGIMTQFIAPLQTGFGLLELVISKSLGGASNVATHFGEVVANVVSYIASFLSGLLGVELQLVGGAEAGAKYTQQAKGLQGAVANSTGAVANNQRAHELANQAIQDRIDTEKDLQKATDDTLSQQERQLQADDKELSAKLALIDATRHASDLEDKLKDDRSAANKAAFSGDFSAMQKAGDALTKDRREQADDQKKAAIEGQRGELRNRLDAIAEQKRANADFHQARIDLLQKELQAAQRAASGSDAAMKSAYAGIAGASTEALTSQIADHLTINESAKSMGATVLSWLKDPWSEEHQKEIGDRVTALTTMITEKVVEWSTSPQARQVEGAMAEMGLRIGTGLAAGVWKGLLQAFGPAGLATFAPAVGFPLMAAGDINSAYNNIVYGFSGKKGKGYAAGGDPPAGVPYWVGEVGPELRVDGPGRIINSQQSRAMTTGGGTVIHNHTNVFPGYLGDNAVVRQMIRQEMAAAHGR